MNPCGLCTLGDGTVVVGNRRMVDDYCIHFYDSSLNGKRLRIVNCDFWLSGLYFAHDDLFGLEEDVSGYDEAAEEGEWEPLSDRERARWGRRVVCSSRSCCCRTQKRWPVSSIAGPQGSLLSTSAAQLCTASPCCEELYEEHTACVLQRSTIDVKRDQPHASGDAKTRTAHAGLLR